MADAPHNFRTTQWGKPRKGVAVEKRPARDDQQRCQEQTGSVDVHHELEVTLGVASNEADCCKHNEDAHEQPLRTLLAVEVHAEEPHEARNVAGMGVKGKEIKKRSDTEESAVLLNRSNSTGARDKQVAAYLREAVLEMGMYQVGTAVAQHGLVSSI
eukprot:1161219-Pelagomonas_calceolata.AAC.1